MRDAADRRRTEAAVEAIAPSPLSQRRPMRISSHLKRPQRSAAAWRAAVRQMSREGKFASESRGGLPQWLDERGGSV